VSEDSRRRPGDRAAQKLAAARAVLHPGAAVRGQLRLTTLRRLRTVSLIAVPVHAAHLLGFWGATTTTPAERDWRAGILVAHALLLVYMAGVSFATSASRRRAEGPLAHLVPWTSLAVFLAAGAAITAVDQLVTSSITPFLVACAVAGLVLLLPPTVALGVYLAGYAMFWWLLGLTQPDPSVLLSNRVNGLTAIALGIGLMLLQWRAEVRDAVQRRRIEAQQEELVARNLELDRLATHDELTGLINRRQLGLMAEHELAAMRRHDQESCLLLIDVDDFKLVNDRLGHPAGDRLLQQLAEQMSSRLRASDLLARWGGEEFLVLLPETDLESALDVGEQLRRSVRETSFAGVDGTVTISVGAAPLRLSAAAPLEDAYRHADRALYEAKSAGRDRVVGAGVDGAASAPGERVEQAPGP
jgi:diguanylate cyclase